MFSLAHEHKKRILRKSQPARNSASVEDKGSFTVDLSRKREKKMSKAVLRHHSFLLYGWIKIRTDICTIPGIDTLYRNSVSSCCKPSCKISYFPKHHIFPKAASLAHL